MTREELEQGIQETVARMAQREKESAVGMAPVIKSVFDVGLGFHVEGQAIRLAPGACAVFRVQQVAACRSSARAVVTAMGAAVFPHEIPLEAVGICAWSYWDHRGDEADAQWAKYLKAVAAGGIVPVGDYRPWKERDGCYDRGCLLADHEGILVPLALYLAAFRWELLRIE